MLNGASKKHSGEQTSKQVATPSVEEAPAPLSEPSELETSGMFPNSYSLPLSEPDTTQVLSRIPRLADASRDLSSKWGIPDADRLLESAGNRRVMRKTAQLTRSGAPLPEPVRLEYRGHKGKRVKNTYIAEQMGTVESSSDSEPAARSAGAPVVDAQQNDGEPVAHSAGAPVIRNLQPHGEPTVMRVGAPMRETSQFLGELAVPPTGAPAVENSQPEAETAAGAVRSRPGEQKKANPEGWTIVASGPSARPTSPRVLGVATRFFPLWFDLSENGDGDPYGPIPKDWLLELSRMPVLPNIKIKS